MFDKIPHKLKLLWCFLFGHNTTKFFDIDALYCVRCCKFLDTNYYRNRSLSIMSLFIRMSAFWTLSGLLALIIIGFMRDFGYWR